MMTGTVMLERRLALAFSALTRGLLYPGSEGDTPYEPFHIALDADRPVTADTLREVLRLAPWWTIELTDGDAWLDETIAWARDPGGGDSPGEADAYQLLRAAMHATLQGPLQRVGIIAPPDRAFHKTRRLVFGRLATGALAGLVANSVET
jgi:hypothetical protein